LECFVIERPERFFTLLERNLLASQLKEKYTILREMMQQRIPSLPKQLAF
jgi:hypothetical protein